MKTTVKLSSDERRAAIIRAVRQVFAEKGFDGTTTRELAQAAGVSEALLFKHFPNKEALFVAMQMACCNEQDLDTFERIRSLEPSASTLALLVHFLVSRVLDPGAAPDDPRAIQNRLRLRSLTEDGEFARLILGRLASEWIPKLQESIEAAVRVGDAVEGSVRTYLAAWFTQHLATILMFHRLPAVPVVDYGVSQEELIDQTVWFCLRGIGLKEEAIRRCYNPRTLAHYAS